MTPSSQQFKGIHSKNCLGQFLPKFSFLWGKFTYWAMCFFNRNIALNCVLKNSLPKIIWKKVCDGVKSKYLTSFIFDIPQNYHLELCKIRKRTSLSWKLLAWNLFLVSLGKTMQSGPSKICRRQPLKNLKWYGHATFRHRKNWIILEVHKRQ